MEDGSIPALRTTKIEEKMTMEDVAMIGWDVAIQLRRKVIGSTKERGHRFGLGKKK